MDAVAVAEVLVVAAGEVEDVGLGEPRRVPVGGGSTTSTGSPLAMSLPADVSGSVAKRQVADSTGPS